jgi:hypothetical protein
MESFRAEAAVLLAATELRGDSQASRLFQSELQELESYTSRLEARLEKIERVVQRDRATDLDELDGRIELAWKQREELLKRVDTGSARNKQPAALQDEHPSRPASKKWLRGAPALPKSTKISPASQGRDTIPAVHAQTHDERSDSCGYVTEEDLAGVSSYMRGRLTLDRINKAIGELTRHAEKNRELLLALKKPNGRCSDRKHALWLSQNISKNAKCKHFVVDTDLKGPHLQMGSTTSRSILTLLRHLNRISETRVNVDGKPCIIYSCLYL